MCPVWRTCSRRRRTGAGRGDSPASEASPADWTHHDLGRGGSGYLGGGHRCRHRRAARHLRRRRSDVYTTDPRIESEGPQAGPASPMRKCRKWRSLGEAKVLHDPLSVELAMAQRARCRYGCRRVLRAGARTPAPGQTIGTVACDERRDHGKAYCPPASPIVATRPRSASPRLARSSRRLLAADLQRAWLRRQRECRHDRPVPRRPRRRRPRPICEFTVGKRDAARAVEIVIAAQG